ncbi:putative aldouronate transport system substrate-binding protein [Paenibacillus algorifonticola]|uniref:Putative aldouronate transport system substrate-binding protein n=1 Tax=Paenibacillus algorifonticola TaxID=684063 RepID=A0A1I2GUA4_9BACL|nr:ABC transporter substrate-binding protein [Paenibacillus algorifonticola]SFF20407.1 putative aldouronate transport system substrate-binding protein [Paenibacillus algorifonticola]
MKKKTTTLLLSIMLVLSLLLAACGSSENGGSASPGGSGSEAGANDSEAVELTMAFINLGTMSDVAAVQEEINKITKSKINATVKLMPIDIAAWNQQVNLLLAGNEPLDLLVTSSFFNYSSQVAKGQLLPLDELLEKYAPEIKNTMPSEIYNGTKIGGSIYGVSSIRDVGADYGMVMRKDLIDKHSIDLSGVKTFEDLGTVFQTIKDKEPGIAPLVQSTQTGTVAYQMYTPQIDPLGDSLGVILLDSNDLKVVNLLETDIFKNKVTLARKWYEAGYIMQDVATTQEQGSSLVKAGKALGYFNNMKPGFEAQESKTTGYEMTSVHLSEPVIQSNGASGFMMSVPRNSENPERAMQLLNLLYTDAEVMNLLANGIEGKHYVKNEDGTIKLPDGVKETTYQFNQWEVGNNFLTYVWEGTDKDIWKQTKKFNESAKVSPALGFSFDATPVKTEVAAATNVVNQYKVGLESGSLDPALIEEYNEKLKAAGLDKIIAEKQKQLDEWAAANGK